MCVHTKDECKDGECECAGLGVHEEGEGFAWAGGCMVQGKRGSTAGSPVAQGV